MLEQLLIEKSLDNNWRLEWQVEPGKCDNPNKNIIRKVHNPNSAAVIIKNRYSLQLLQVPVLFVLEVLPHLRFQIREELLRRKRTRI